MMFPPSQSSGVAGAAQAAGTVAELLDVLRGRGQDGALLGSLPPSQLRALTVLEAHEGLNLRAMSDALGSCPSAVSRLCDRLEAAALLERTPSPLSGREVELRLTARGRATLAEIRAARHREVADVLAMMTRTQLAALSEGLEAFQDAARSRISHDASLHDAVTETA